MIEEGEHLTLSEEPDLLIDDTVTCPLHDGRWGADPTCSLCTDGDGEPLPEPTDAVELLNAIIQSAQDAQVALKDEHEGRFTRHVIDLHLRADLLADLVTGW